MLYSWTHTATVGVKGLSPTVCCGVFSPLERMQLVVLGRQKVEALWSAVGWTDGEGRVGRRLFFDGRRYTDPRERLRSPDEVSAEGPRRWRNGLGPASSASIFATETRAEDCQNEHEKNEDNASHHTADYQQHLRPDVIDKTRFGRRQIRRCSSGSKVRTGRAASGVAGRLRMRRSERRSGCSRAVES